MSCLMLAKRNRKALHSKILNAVKMLIITAATVIVIFTHEGKLIVQDYIRLYVSRGDVT